jgi:hypothetical protein
MRQSQHETVTTGDSLDFGQGFVFGVKPRKRKAYNKLRLIAFDQVVQYKKHMTGGSFNIGAAYVQLLNIIYDAIENKTDNMKIKLDKSMKLFIDEVDNEMIQNGIDFDLKIGMI